MPRIKLGRPSPALVIACISLFVALGGVGYAAATGSIDGREIKNSSVASKDIKNNSLVGGDVKTSGLTGSDVRANSLTGSDISESRLGKVPSASTADSASSASSANSVGGVTFRKVNYRSASTTPTNIFNAGGLSLTANCSPANTLSLTATTTKQDSSIFSSIDDLESATDQVGNDLEQQTFDTNTPFNMLDGGSGAAGGADDPALVHFEFDALDGTVITGILATDEVSLGNNCRVSGHVTVG